MTADRDDAGADPEGDFSGPRHSIGLNTPNFSAWPLPPPTIFTSLTSKAVRVNTTKGTRVPVARLVSFPAMTLTSLSVPS